MSDATRAGTRYQAVAARYQELLTLSIGHAIDVEAAEASPDGALVAAVLRIRDGLEGEGHAELHLLATDGSRRWQVTGADGDASDPRWSRGGSRLTFLADHGTRHRNAPWLLAVGPDGPEGEPRRLDGPPGFPEHQRPSPDGERLLLTMAGEHAEQADGLGSGTIGDKAGGHDEAAWVPAVETTEGADEWRSAWILDVETGAIRRVSPEGLNTWEADWVGPDAIVSVLTDGPSEDAWYEARLARIDIDTGAVTTLHAPEWQIQFATGSPDGRSVAVIEAVASDRYYTTGEVVVVAADGTGTRVLPSGDADIGAVRWLDDRRLVALGVSGMQTVVGVMDLETGWRETWRGDTIVGGWYLHVSAVGDAGDVVLPLNGADVADRLSVIEGGVERVLLPLDHPGQAPCGAAVASQRVVSWTGRDGWRIEGLLRLPHGDPPFATILWVHGGPVGATGQSWLAPEMALFLEAGYAVLTSNPRGSTGRGRAFAAAVVGDMGGEDSYDLLAGVEHLVAEGIADPARIAVGGFSYGGYMAAHLPTLSERFAAAIVSSPLTDMVSSYYGSSLTVFVRDYVGGHPATETDLYVARSPVFARERLRTPSLITTGGRDRATPAGQAVELYRALREQGVAAELVVYPKEGHGISDLAARGDWIARSIAWLERWMPARPRPDDG